MKPVKFVLMLPVYFIGLLFVMLILSKLNQAFWDARVRSLCATEGIATVFETIDLRAPEYSAIPKDLRGIPFVSDGRNGKPDSPFYRTSDSTLDKKLGGISIMRYTNNIVRASDDKILGTQTGYSRGGGDFLNVGGPGTIYSCSHITSPFELSIKVFELKGKQ